MYIKYKRPVAITQWASVVGKKESCGPLSGKFDEECADDYFGQTTWEKAETELQTRCIGHLLHKKGIDRKDVEFITGGDLCNQITSTAYTMRAVGAPFMGLYNACSTMAEGMIAAACMVDGGYASNAVALASSHFCTAERQFRTPLDYGGKRTPTAQWTVTGCGCVMFERFGKGPFITAAQLGRVVDLGVKDANNMGAAMAPAATETLKRFLYASGTECRDYDAIYTGDLGRVGSELFFQLLQNEKINIENHTDCGCVIFDKSQNVQSGASGCGCGASVLAADILPRFESGDYRNILFIATGALMSPATTMQGESIPCIAHLVNIKNKEEAHKK
ncbi:MAG: stage V sporulation protein AD [Oscillospiraceae bacterium]|nr:stage V sporulation protein AD [Oscillospiraceae bacterium]